MTKFFALAAAATLAVAPLAASADEAVRVVTDKSSQSAILAGSSALTVGAVIVIAGVLFAVVADGSSATGTTLVALPGGTF
ncbi:hypothetical protein [Jannaschia pohangensis]|uniref:Uncharacterized protein n=1 Tax=Jannaschia pohangensis TaxID=390807 RepID=A0A1I3U713_9RHOB|nr:hypothetical protein [Jannaschia pohangensis]SFJ79314.1 hypothetical protein SAMN04488095_3671 [Jannaschia pohangensis]